LILLPLSKEGNTAFASWWSMQLHGRFVSGWPTIVPSLHSLAENRHFFHLLIGGEPGELLLLLVALSLGRILVVLILLLLLLLEVSPSEHRLLLFWLASVVGTAEYA
jgi:hypothetical protein